ncbi:MAG TPA: Ig-like domain-containing protein, partial [Candidatus Limnocylindrales bacterium]
SLLGDPVTFAVAVSSGQGGPPTGGVTLTIDSGQGGSGTLNAAGVASFDPTSDLSVGSHTVIAAYLGDAIFAPSTSAPLIQEVIEPPPTPAPTPTTYATLTSRTWAQLAKAPDSYIAKGYKVWGCITQFDAATGLGMFRAQASYRDETYWYTDGKNAFFSGDQTQLTDFVQNDVVVMNVVDLGSYTYDTQNGGSTTVPEFQIDKIQRKGSC